MGEREGSQVTGLEANELELEVWVGSSHEQ